MGHTAAQRARGRELIVPLRAALMERLVRPYAGPTGIRGLHLLFSALDTAGIFTVPICTVYARTPVPYDFDL